jgi:hypothetical protein
VLKLGYNRIRCNGARAIAAGFAKGGKAHSINLSCNLIEKRGWQALIDHLATTPSLKKLDLRNSAGAFSGLDCRFPSDEQVLLRLVGFPIAGGGGGGGGGGGVGGGAREPSTRKRRRVNRDGSASLS